MQNFTIFHMLMSRATEFEMKLNFSNEYFRIKYSNYEDNFILLIYL